MTRQPATIEHFPTEQFRDKNGPCEIKHVVASITAATNNVQAIAGVSGKRLRIISGNMRSAGAQGAITFKSASAGTNKRAYEVPANTVATPNVYLPPDQFGHFETAAGEGVFADNTSANIITVSLAYIEYTP